MWPFNRKKDPVLPAAHTPPPDTAKASGYIVTAQGKIRLGNKVRLAGIPGDLTCEQARERARSLVNQYFPNKEVEVGLESRLITVRDDGTVKVEWLAVGMVWELIEKKE